MSEVESGSDMLNVKLRLLPCCRMKTTCNLAEATRSKALGIGQSGRAHV